MSETRSRVRDCIYHKPGIHFNGISRELDIATGQTQYHLRQLCTDGRVTKEEVSGQTHYYPPTYSAWERGVIALLRRETSREIIMFLLRNEETTPAAISDRLDLARSTVEWHLTRLVDHEIVDKRSTDSGNTVLALRHSEDVYRLLREIEPRLVDRLSDRFARLTDSLLDD